MSQGASGDVEKGKTTDGGQTRSAPNQPPQGEFIFGDSSGPLFSLYSKATEKEDKKMVKRWQKYADGVFIFTGLFSAAVASLLTLTVPGLSRSSQDTSAFYLGNIYEVLADPNTTRAHPVANQLPFSPPRYLIWVNSLWFSSLVMSLCCALLATSLHQWARRYVRFTRHEGRTVEKRARMRAFFASGVDKLRIPWAVEGLPTLLHLSLLLFFAGLAIFLFNVNRDVFECVAVWIGLFLMLYGLITLLPLLRHDSPYYTPLSIPAWYMYAGIPFVTFKVLAFIVYKRYGSNGTWKRCDALQDRYGGWVSGGMEKLAEEMASEQSPEIDVDILDWTISTLGDDDSLEEVFMAIPGFFNSKLVKDPAKYFPETLLERFWSVLDGFMGRTLSSNLVSESVKSRRVKICRDIMIMIPCLNDNRLHNLRSHFDQAPGSIEGLQIMARWFSHFNDVVAEMARIKAAKYLSRIRERDGRWIALASDVYNLSPSHLQHNVALGGDNVLLATLIEVSRRAIHSDDLGGVVEALTQFDIHNTLPGLQHDFCAMWNDFVQEARDKGFPSVPVVFLCWIRHLYITLHEGTDAAPTAFSASTSDRDPILDEPSSFPFCNIVSHCRPNSPALSLSTQPTSSSNPVTPGETEDSSQPSAATSLALPHASTRHTDASPPDDVAAALQNIYPDTTMSQTLAGTSQRDIAAASAASAFNSLPPATSGLHSSAPASPLPSRVPILPNAELLTLLSSARPSRPTDNATLPRLRGRGLVNTGGLCFANAVLQLLVHSPPFWNLFRELGDLKGLRGEVGLEISGGATPLLDATVRLVDEFTFKESEPPSIQRPHEQAAGAEPREDKEAKKGHGSVDSFEPVYMYDAMKEKRQLKNLLGKKHEDAENFLGLYLDALDEELVELHTYIRTHMLASTASAEKLEEGAPQAGGQAEVGKREHTESSFDSPISRIFGGKSRLTVGAPNQLDTVTIEAWRSLKLYIQPDSVQTIQDALAQVTQLQPVQVGQSSSSAASQQLLLETLPPILVIHFERFRYDAAAGCINKVNKAVQFGSELGIPPEIMAPIAGRSSDPAHYKLYGVLCHHGESIGCGHYTVDVLRTNGDDNSEAWLHVDDEAVSVVQYEDVSRGRDNERVDDRCVYMLFYCRTAPTDSVT